MIAVTQQRYSTVAIILHWVMAVAFVLMLGSGASFSLIDMPQSFKFNLYQWHKSLGVLLLCTFFVRIGWRLLCKPPAMPSSIQGMERKVAHAGHWALYAMPLSGWVMVSSSVYGLPTIVFGLFEWPHLPNMAGNETISRVSKMAHYWLAITFALLIAGHIAAVIKHAVCDKENLLARMSIGRGISRSIKSICAIAVAIGLIAVPALAHDFTFDRTGSAVNFSGYHAGNAFKGHFEKWDATISFDADNLDATHIRVTFDVTSATTGNAMYDGALLQGDWLDAKNHPQAVFETKNVTRIGDGSGDKNYRAEGTLTLRGVTHPVVFDFALSDPTQASVTATGQLVLKRLDYGIGTKAEWVSEDIVVTFDIVAARSE